MLLWHETPTIRIVQPAGTRGSQKWIQKAVIENWESLNQPILNVVGARDGIVCLSPFSFFLPQKEILGEWLRSAAASDEVGGAGVVG